MLEGVASSTESLTLPKNSFALPETAYNNIGEPVLFTNIVPPKLELPDLRTYLSYYGTNARPDIGAASKLLYFGLKGSETPVGVMAGEKLFLRYDSTKKPGTFIFSPDNLPTNLWITATKDDNKANVEVEMNDERGVPVTEPAIRASFALTARDFTRTGGPAWEIGKFKVDGTLLARQRARWFGQDQFLNQHGGEEFADQIGRERVEFGEGNERYVIYVKENDCLIWDGQKWHSVQIGEASRNFPLMCVNKIDDRLMRLDLWDAGGQGHVALNLVKSKEAWSPKSFEQDFKFISSRTLSQYVFQIKKERMVLRPFDWLLMTDTGWKPLTTVEEIDAYVERKTPGVLFVFSGPSQKDDKQVLKGVLYSPSRTDTSEVLFPFDQAAILGGTRPESESSSPPPANMPESMHDQPEVDLPAERVIIPNAAEEDPSPLQQIDQAPAEMLNDGHGSLEELQSMHPPVEIEIPENVILAPSVAPEAPDETLQQRVEEPASPVEEFSPVEPQAQISEAPIIVKPRNRKEPSKTVQVKKGGRKPGQLRDEIKFLLQDNNK